MQQYIYGNFHHAGFRTVSSDTSNFFMEQADKLLPMMAYDSETNHGELQTGEHKSFWMQITDLKIPGGRDYLFVQESGLDPFRVATVVQGYRSDAEDSDEVLFGSAFTDLLGIRFVPNQEALKNGEDNNVRRVPFADLPKDAVTAATLSPEALEMILLALFQKKRTIIRIPALGADAMIRSKQYLKAIYQCLPYEKRRNNGCITGASKKMITQYKSFRILLLDADTDATNIATNDYQAFFDMKSGTLETAQQSESIPLVTFLVHATQEQRDNFFRYCRKSLAEDGVKGDPDIEKYDSLLKEYLLGEKTISGQEILYWAVNLNDRKERFAGRKTELHKKIAALLRVEDLVSYLREKAPEYMKIHKFGVLDRIDRNMDNEKPRDQNAALTLQMMTALPDYSCDSVRDRMTEHFVSLAVRENPCLASETPLKSTLDACAMIKLPNTEGGSNAWVKELLAAVRGELETIIGSRKELYARNYQSQKEDGERKILAFAGENLESLYGQLAEHYLKDELMGGWNSLLAQQIVKLCENFPHPRSADGYPRMRGQMEAFRNVFRNHQGEFTQEQDQRLKTLDQNWEAMEAFIARQCRSARDLDQWIREADKADWHPELREEEKRGKAGALLQQIPDGLSLEETKARLACAAKYRALLQEPKIAFLPWEVRAEPEKILPAIERLENYPQDGEPKLSSRKICDWITRMLPHNKDLMILLIRKYPERQAELVPILAKRGKGITQADIRQMYLTGCARSVLLGQRGKETSAEWREAVDAFLPELPILPEPLKTQAARKQPLPVALLVAVQVLLGLAALLPGTVLLLTGSGTPGLYGIVTGVVAACAAGFGTAAMLTKAKPGKRFLLGLALSVVPGLLVGIAGLILNFL